MTRSPRFEPAVLIAARIVALRRELAELEGELDRFLGGAPQTAQPRRGRPPSDKSIEARIVRVLRGAGVPMRAPAIAAQLGRRYTPNYLGLSLTRLVRKGQIERRGRGLYVARKA